VIIEISSGRSGGPVFSISFQSVKGSIQSDNIKIDNKNKNNRSPEEGEQPNPETFYFSSVALCCL
jgi:hypothetical protein